MCSTFSCKQTRYHINTSSISRLPPSSRTSIKFLQVEAVTYSCTLNTFLECKNETNAFAKELSNEDMEIKFHT
jgi:hypothetical protein